MKNFHKTVALVAVLAAFTTGCRSTAEYKKLAEAGNKYAQAVDQLLITAGDMSITATSEKMLETARISPISLAKYEELNQADKDRLQILQELRHHNQLLHDYFSRLQELATSDAPERVQAEIEGIVNNLNASSQKLQSSNLITHKGVIQAVTSLVVDSKIRGALRDELEKRNQTVLQELTIQQEMLDALRDSIQHDAKIIQSLREGRLVVRPLMQSQPIEQEDEWIQKRKYVLTLNTKIAELQEASTALGEFKEIFQAAVSGKLSLERLNNGLKDIDAFLALVTPQN